ncbi:MAG: 2-C-methyl-D-erythritol 2,4-cyclodiphosphate synthase [Bacillales bacterium]|nr:2-C-methyl-D-erythritol 2,4-cyclodiphosphate synthase [Bacillales bacterium]
MRIGNSVDFHPFSEDRLLILGGVTIPYSKGLMGVSDADVVLHAIAEAILGALALGDLGCFFKEEDSKDLDSKIILRKVKDMMDNASYKIGNIDVMILLEEPKIEVYIPMMKELIATILDTEFQRISIKATTMEGCGIIGKGEGCMALATVLLDEVVYYGRNSKWHV